MDLPDLLLHFVNFIAPVLALALVLPVLARIMWGKKTFRLAWWPQFAINSIVGGAVLLVNLWWWGRDGKMAAYAALVLALASSQWLLVRGWRA